MVHLPYGSPPAMVVLTYVIEIDGSVSDAKIVISSRKPDLDADVLKSFSQRPFHPATLAGKPVAVRVATRAVFSRSASSSRLPDVEADVAVYSLSDLMKSSRLLGSDYLKSGAGEVRSVKITYPPSFTLVRGHDDELLGKHSEALADFDEAVKDNPDDAIALQARGFVNEELGHNDRAVQDETLALSIAPHYPIALMDRAFAYGALGQRDLAKADYEALMEIAPPCVPVRTFEDSLCHDAYGARIAALDKRIAIKANDFEAYTRRCAERAIANAGLSMALADCNRVLDVAPDDATALSARGLVFYRMGVFPSALKDYDASLKKDPHSANSLYMRGLIKTRLNDIAGGRADVLAARAHEAAVAANMAFCGIYP